MPFYREVLEGMRMALDYSYQIKIGSNCAGIINKVVE
jgi:hypothetical protein